MDATLQPTEDDFFFASEQEKEEGIYTHNKADGTIVKKIWLPNCKRLALVRQGTNRDFLEVGKLTDKAELQVFALLSVTTLLDGRKACLDDIENLLYQDLMKLVMAVNNLNWEFDKHYSVSLSAHKK